VRVSTPMTSVIYRFFDSDVQFLVQGLGRSKGVLLVF